MSGKDITKIKKVDDSNKDVNEMAEIICNIPYIDALVQNVESEEQLL